VQDDLDNLDRQYEAAEAAFLDEVRRSAPREALALTAAAVARAAEAFNAEAYRSFHESTGDRRGVLDGLTERTEVLSELWRDLAAAFRDQGVPATDDVDR
jgi:hypothetical protein